MQNQNESQNKNQTVSIKPDSFRFEITRKEIEKWCAQFGEYNILRRTDKDHITFQLEQIVHWYNGIPNYLGHFLTAIVSNDFVKATCYADLTNYKCLCVYAKFLYNVLPQDWRIKRVE